MLYPADGNDVSFSDAVAATDSVFHRLLPRYNIMGPLCAGPVKPSDMPFKDELEIISWRPSLLWCSFLVTFLFKNDEKYSLDVLPSSGSHFLLHS